MQTNSELYKWLTLTLTPKIGPISGLKLLNHFGSIENIFLEDVINLSKIIPAQVAQTLISKKAEPLVEKSLKWLSENPNRHIMCLKDSNYPKNLANTSAPPLILYMEGNLGLINNPQFSIVGTRHPTGHGIESAYRFARDLANNQLTITSGMALGIDKHAHIGGLKGESKSIGVIGTGIDLTYPMSNKELYSQMLNEGGLIISEFPLQTPPHVSNFPRRNRIIAGLSLGCLVVESDIDGGSMISANYSLEMGREVMAIPGSIYNPVARGCHKLIKNGAKLVENVNDILEELNLESNNKKVNSTTKALINHNNDPILKVMGTEPITIDQICEKLELEFSEACALLLKLELDEKIINCGHGKYQRLIK